LSYIPLLRSKNDSKYNIDTAGNNLASNFLNKLFSLIAPVTSTSESLAAGDACFSGDSSAMVAGDVIGPDSDQDLLENRDKFAD
jgi:hypothetical protein